MAAKLLSRAQAKAAFGGMPERTFARWCSQGMPRQGEKFPWPEIHHWLLQQVERRGRDSVKPANLEEARLREVAAKADLLEMEVAEKRGDLVAVAQYEVLVGDAFARVKATLDAVPARWAAEFAAACSVAEAQLKLRKALAEVLAELYRGADVPDEVD